MRISSNKYDITNVWNEIRFLITEKEETLQAIKHFFLNVNNKTEKP